MGGSPWLVGRFPQPEPAADDDKFLQRGDELGDWIRRLGLDPSNMLACCAVVEVDGRFELHLSERLLEDGRPRVDLARGIAASKPVVVNVEHGSWPSWLTGLGTSRE